MWYVSNCNCIGGKYWGSFFATYQEAKKVADENNRFVRRGFGGRWADIQYIPNVAQ